MPFLELEQPLYTFRQKESRSIIPKVLSLLFLSIIFYMGILLNISLLDLNADEETAVKTVSLLLLVIIVGIGIVLAVRHARHPYYFYRDRIVHNNKLIYYASISQPVRQAHFFDKIFKTHALNLGSGFFIRHVPDDIALEDYILKLKEYSSKLTAQN